MFSSPVLYIDSFTDIGFEWPLNCQQGICVVCLLFISGSKTRKCHEHSCLAIFLSKYIYIKQNEMKMFIVFNLQHVF